MQVAKREPLILSITLNTQYNIGDVRTLVIHPSSTIYAHSTEAQKQSAGVYEDSIRVSVGIEDIKDLIEDFEQAINKMNASSYNS